MKGLLFTLLLLISSSVFSATYYVKSGGDDNANGLSDATAWATISKVNNTISGISDDVYFSCGDQWTNEQLWVDWAGTNNDRSNIGSYYISNGSPVLNACVTNRPHFRGSYLAPDYLCGIGANTTAVSSSAVPGDYYTGLINVISNYVTVTDIYVSHSAGRAFNSTSADYVSFDSVEAYFTCAGAIRLKTSDNAIIRNSVFHANVLYPSLTGFTGGGRPPCVEVTNSGNAVVENNTMYDCYMENIGIYDAGSTNAIIRGNLIHGVNRIGIYFSEGRDGVAESNVLVGQSGGIAEAGFYDANNNAGGTAFAVVTENEASQIDTSGNIIRNNLIANVSTCIRTSVATINGIPVATVNNEFYGNTCIGASFKAILEYNSNSILTVKNNIFMEYADDCDLSNNDVFDYNVWNNGIPVDSDCVGVNDINSGTTITKTSGWDTVGTGNIPTVTDFTQTVGSSGLNAGETLNTIKWTALDFPAEQLARTISGNFDYTLNSEDYTNTARGSPPEIGAIEATATAPTTETIPYYQAPSSLVNIVVSNVYQAQEYTTFDGCSPFYNTTTNSIANTTDDLLYQRALGCNGTINIAVPVPNGTYDIIYRTAELYYSVQDTTLCNSANGVRTFDILIEGLLVEDELNVCVEAGAAELALNKTYAGVIVSDGTLNLSLVKGTSTADGKPIISGFDIVTAGVGSILTIGNSTPPTTELNNLYPSATPVAASTICNASTTYTGGLSISAINTISITNAVCLLDQNNIQCTPTNASISGPVGSMIVSFSDDINTSNCTIQLSFVSLPKVLFNVQINGVPATSTTGWWWRICKTKGSLLNAECIEATAADETTDSNGDIEIFTDFVSRGEWVTTTIQNINSFSVGGRTYSGIEKVETSRVR